MTHFVQVNCEHVYDVPKRNAVSHSAWGSPDRTLIRRTAETVSGVVYDASAAYRRRKYRR